MKKAILISLALLIFASCGQTASPQSSIETSSEFVTSIETSSEIEQTSSLETSSEEASSQFDFTAEKDSEKMNSMTLSLYNNNSCSITWHMQNKPKNPVALISSDIEFSNPVECPVTVEEKSSFKYPDDKIFNYYILKSVFTDLKAGERYFYKIRENGVESKTRTFIAPDPQKTSFKFITLSDSQIASDDGVGTGEKFSTTVRGIEANAFNPDFILHTGDVVEWTKYEAFWEDMINQNQAFFSQTPFAAISGNHETTYRSGFRETFKHFNYQLPEQIPDNGIYYSFDYGNARFIMLNSNELMENKLPENQYNWLISQLQNNPQKWTIVSIHNPLYSIGKYGSNPERNATCLALREQLADIFVKYNVDLVLQGHDHAYSKTYPIAKGGEVTTPQTETINGVDYALNPQGTIYMMNGPAGDETRAPFEIDEKIYEFADTGASYSWMECEIDENTLTVKIYSNKSGAPTLWKSFGIKK